jgi:hypothetical protein
MSSVVPDNLPLPWSFATPGGVRVAVGVRDRVLMPLPAQRMRRHSARLPQRKIRIGNGCAAPQNG